VLGFLSNDTVTFGGIPIQQVQFGQAIYMADFFAVRLKKRKSVSAHKLKDVPIDGILGLAFPDIATDSVVPVLDQMWAQNLIPKFQFSTFLSSTVNGSDSALFLGGVDPDYYSGSFVWADVIAESYWLIGMSKVSVNSSVVHHCGLGYCPTVIDTGTSILLFSPEVGDPILRQIPPVWKNGNSRFQFSSSFQGQVGLLQHSLASDDFVQCRRHFWRPSTDFGTRFV
jgi:hypothetical protein